jgi:hypothetical protein
MRRVHTSHTLRLNGALLEILIILRIKTILRVPKTKPEKLLHRILQ